MKNDIVKRPIIAPGRTINDVQPAPAMVMQAPALPTMTPQQQQVVEQPIQEQPVQQQPAQNQATPEQAPQEQQTAPEEQEHMEAQLHPNEEHIEHHQSHTPAGAIFLATVVFLILAAGAVYSQLQASGSSL